MLNILFKKGLVIGIIFLFVGISFASSIAVDKVNKSLFPVNKSRILYVGGTGPGNFSFIQNAINNATPGDTIFVLDDSAPYYENVVIDKSINLFGENKDTTIIDGMKKSYVILVKAHDVHIRGFTIKNATKNLPNAPAGIYCQSLEGSSWDNLHIEHNIITENPHGINFLRSHNSNISNNIIKSNEGIGLHIWLSDNFTCYKNEITMNGDWAIFFIEVPNSRVTNNRIFNNGGAIKISWRMNNTLISDNIMNYNTGHNYGLWLMMYCCNNTIKNNYFKNYAGFYEINLAWEKCINNNFYHNEIYGICYDEETLGKWNDIYPFGGNYWSGYSGEDNYHGENQDQSGSDGIGDTPYYFSVNSMDRYPLIEPYIENWIPYARFSYLEDKYNVSFDASSSFDFQGSIVSYEWDFGDGTSGEGKTISHDYNEPGKYYVTLEVTDDDGTSDAYSWEVLLFPISDLSCEGDLVWYDVKPGETIVGSFMVENNGSSGSFLDWEIIVFPEWGVWSFDPNRGTNLSGGDSVGISVEVIAPDEPNTAFVGEVIVVNSENPGDHEIIDVILSTPRPRATTYLWYQWFLERAPVLMRVLYLILLN